MQTITPADVPPLFCDVAPAQRTRYDDIDVYTPAHSGRRPRPAVVLIHGGPVTPQHPARDRPVSLGLGALAASRGLVGIAVQHRLHGWSGTDFANAADDVAAAVEHVRALDEVDGDRIGLWCFSAGGPLAVDWMTTTPAWLRCLAWTYPVLAPPADWDGDIPRFDAIAALDSCAQLPKLLVRVGDEIPDLVPNQDQFVTTSRERGFALDIIDVADVPHGFEENDEVPDHASAAVHQAMNWIATELLIDRA